MTRQLFTIIIQSVQIKKIIHIKNIYSHKRRCSPNRRFSSYISHNLHVSDKLQGNFEKRIQKRIKVEARQFEYL